MTDGLPPKPSPPAALLRLRELEARWGEVVDWVLEATTAATEYRSEAFAAAHLFYIVSSEMPSQYQRALCDIDRRYHARLAEIDQVESEMKRAYNAAKDSMHRSPEDEQELEAYHVVIQPYILAERVATQRLLNDMQIEKANKKIELYKARDERRQRRLERKLLLSKEEGR